MVRPSPPLNIYFPIPYLIYFIIENVVTITRTSTFQFFMVPRSSSLHLTTTKFTTFKKDMRKSIEEIIPLNTRHTQKYPKIPENTRHTRKYPRVKKIPGNTQSYISTLLPDPTRPATRYFVQYPTRPDIEKPYPLGPAHTIRHVLSLPLLASQSDAHTIAPLRDPIHTQPNPLIAPERKKDRQSKIKMQV